MTRSGAIRVRDLRVAFDVASHDAPRSLKQAVLGGPRRRARPTVALDAIDLDVAPGQAVGIVGHNGAGKSTLLQVVAGLLPATSGRVEVGGRVGAMLEIGAGFHHELTGRESAVTAAIVAGLRRREAQALLPTVAAYAELDDDVLDRPVRTYSTGMRARLAFAVAVHVAPDLLLVDEVLSVGDMAFQARCLATMRDFRDRGVTLLVVTHDTSLLPEVCDRAVWLRHGAVAMDGRLEDVLAAHRDAAAPPPTVHPARSGHVDGRGDGAARVEQVGLVVSPGHLRVRAGLVAPHDVRVQCKLVDREGRTVVDTSCLAPGSRTGHDVDLDVDLPHLAAGAYRVRVSLYSHDWELAHDVDGSGVPLAWPGPPRDGVLDPPVRWRVDGRELA